LPRPIIAAGCSVAIRLKSPTVRGLVDVYQRACNVLAACMNKSCLAVLALVAAAPATAQTRPDPEPGYRIVTPDRRPFLHGWRTTLDYGQGAGPIEDAASRIGYSRSNEAKLGLEFGLGPRGFARLEAGRGWRDTKRALRFDDLKGEADDTALGITGGVFLLPFLAAGLYYQYRFGDGEDVFTNRAIGSDTVIGRDDRLRRTAPFLLLTAPAGPVQATLLGAYVDIATDTDYSNAPIASDSGRVKATLVDASLAWWMTPDIEIGGSIGWTHVSSQRVQADALPLDTDTGTVGLRVTYRLTRALDAALRGSQDFANDRGDGFRFGGGLAYRF
jgi:hypothetical protein